MKRRFIILCILGVCLTALMPYRLIASVEGCSSWPNTYVDDSYYWPSLDTMVTSEPVYDRNAREFIFLEDTMQHPDTVRMRIIER